MSEEIKEVPAKFVSIVEKIDAQHETIRKELKAFEAKLPRASK